MERLYEILDKESVYKVDKIVYRDKQEEELAVVVRNLSFNFDSTPVLTDVSFEIPRGQWVCIVGPSGTGKSTFLNILMKHFPVPDGTVFLFGKDINKYTAEEILGLITLVEQEPQLLSELTVLENLTIWVEKSVEEIRKVAFKLGMGDLLDKISTDKKVLLASAGLSGGEKKRLSILRGLLRDTSIVILDEPTAFVDEESGLNILSDLRNNLKDKTVIITTHDSKVIKFCDRVVNLGGNYT